MEVQAKSKLDNLLCRFEDDCERSMELYYTIQELNNQYPSDYSNDIRDCIIEGTIMKLFAKWEGFLESVFLEYMMGQKSDNGEAIKRYVNPVDYEHAYRMIQKVNAYPEWADVDKIIGNAENFFENGGSFAILHTMRSEINAIRKIRNSIAHLSQKAKTDFEQLVRGLVGYLPDNITPAIFLTFYKKGNKKKDPTYFEYYVKYLNDTAKILVEYHTDCE